MAKQTNNMVMQSTRGMLGKQVVFKKRAGRIYVAAPPAVNENRKPTENQQLAQARFKRSITYASSAVRSPELRKAYKAAAGRGQSAQNVAFKDSYFAPEVVGMITQGYLGTIGNIIVVHAKDDFMVKAVKVSIHNSNNELIEEGPATLFGDNISWIYTVTQQNVKVPGSVIRATAMDLPENEGFLQVTL